MLSDLGVRFSASASGFEEPPHRRGIAPAAYVAENARGKALDIAARCKKELVVGSDTAVVYRGRVLGKPATIQEAAAFLNLLNGRTHAVFTGMCIVDTSDGTVLTDYEKTLVRFRQLSPHELECYLSKIDPMDKAGAYAIQGPGAIVVASIKGCYYNVVGFPVAKLEQMLVRLGYSLFDFMDRDRT